MASVAVQRYPKTSQSIWSLLDETRGLFNQIQKHAYELFERRGRIDGMDLDDWLQAEKDALEIPMSELSEEDGKIHVKAAVPGLTPRELHVTATPHELVIRGERHKEQEGKKGTVHFREFNQKQMLRRYSLPAEVDVQHITANLQNGVLDVELPKAVQREVKVTGRTRGKAAA